MKLSDKTLRVLWTLRQWGWDIFSVVLILVLAVLVWRTAKCPQRIDDKVIKISFWTEESPMLHEANQCIEPLGYVHDDEPCNNMSKEK